MSTEPSPLSASSTPTAVTDTGRTDGSRPSADASPERADATRADGRPVADRDTPRPDTPRPDTARPDTAGPDTAIAGAPLAGRREAARREAELEAWRKAQGATDRPTPPREGPRRAPARRKRKVRKVHRVVRHIEVWSLAKLAAIFVACGYVVAMVAGYLLWRAADRVGTIEGIEGFMEDSGGYDTFDILGDVVFRAAAAIGVVLGFVTVAIIVLGAVLFNLISDLTGGIRMTVIDEDLIVTPARRPPASPAGGPGADGPTSPPTDPRPGRDPGSD